MKEFVNKDFLIKAVKLIDEYFANLLTGTMARARKRTYFPEAAVHRSAEAMKTALCEYIDLKVESFINFTKTE